MENVPQASSHFLCTQAQKLVILSHELEIITYNNMF